MKNLKQLIITMQPNSSPKNLSDLYKAIIEMLVQKKTIIKDINIDVDSFHKEKETVKSDNPIDNVVRGKQLVELEEEEVKKEQPRLELKKEELQNPHRLKSNDVNVSMYPDQNRLLRTSRDLMDFYRLQVLNKRDDIIRTAYVNSIVKLVQNPILFYEVASTAEPSQPNYKRRNKRTESINFQDENVNPYSQDGVSVVQIKQQQLKSEMVFSTTEIPTSNQHNKKQSEQLSNGIMSHKNHPPKKRTSSQQIENVRVKRLGVQKVANPSAIADTFLGTSKLGGVQMLMYTRYRGQRLKHTPASGTMLQIPKHKKPILTKVKKWTRNTAWDLMNFAVDAEVPSYDALQKGNQVHSGLNILRDVQTVETSLADYPNQYEYQKGTQYQGLEVLKGTETKPLEYLPNTLVSGIQTPTGSTYNLGFYFFSLLENVVQNDVQKRDEFICIERGTNDQDLEISYSPQRKDRRTKDQLIKRTLKGQLTNKVSKQREYVEKSITRYVPEGVVIDIAVGEKYGTSDRKHNQSTHMKDGVVQNKHQLAEIVRNQSNQQDRDGERNSKILLPSQEKNLLEEGKELLRNHSYQKSRESECHGIYDHTSLYQQSTRFSKKRYVQITNALYTDRDANYDGEDEEHEDQMIVMELHTPNNLVSKIDKEIGYKLSGNLIELVNEMNLYSNHGPQLGSTMNRVQQRNEKEEVDSQVDSPIVHVGGVPVANESYHIGDGMNGTEADIVYIKEYAPQYRNLSLSKHNSSWQQIAQLKHPQKFAKRTRYRKDPDEREDAQPRKRSQVGFRPLEMQVRNLGSLLNTNLLLLHDPAQTKQRAQSDVKVEVEEWTNDVDHAYAMQTFIPLTNDLVDRHQYPDETQNLESRESYDDPKERKRTMVQLDTISQVTGEQVPPVPITDYNFTYAEPEPTGYKHYSITQHNQLMTKKLNRKFLFTGEAIVKEKQVESIRRLLRSGGQYTNLKAVGTIEIGTNAQKGLRVSRDAVKYHRTLEAYFGHQSQDPFSPSVQTFPDKEETLRHDRYGEFHHKYEQDENAPYLKDTAEYRSRQQQRGMEPTVEMKERFRRMLYLRQKVMVIHNNYESFLIVLKYSIDSMKRDRESQVNPMGLSAYSGYGYEESQYIEFQLGGSQGYQQLQDGEYVDEEIPELDYDHSSVMVDMQLANEGYSRKVTQPVLQYLQPKTVRNEQGDFYPQPYLLGEPQDEEESHQESYQIPLENQTEVQSHQFEQTHDFKPIYMPSHVVENAVTNKWDLSKSRTSPIVKFKVPKNVYDLEHKEIVEQMVYFKPQVDSLGTYRLHSSDPSLRIPNGITQNEFQKIQEEVDCRIVYQSRPITYQKLGKQEEGEHHKEYEPHHMNYEEPLLELDEKRRSSKESLSPRMYREVYLDDSSMRDKVYPPRKKSMRSKER